MRRRGARVAGHTTVARVSPDGTSLACSCGYASALALSHPGACLLLVQHLEDAVRRGAAVIEGDGGDPAGVREPRNPRVPHLGAASLAEVIRPVVTGPEAAPPGAASA